MLFVDGARDVAGAASPDDQILRKISHHMKERAGDL